MMPINELFSEQDRDAIYAFFETRERWHDIVRWRTLEHGPVDTIFYGDSIFEIWPTAEAFPELSHLNRGSAETTSTGSTSGWMRISSRILRGGW
ncbi:MAG: hypothetical protein L6W00_24950 [Lentisphaeria bacterium]|nr:MAG: hypothetical protein L6W00_24950 [Lentisphaeria bacterium]